MSRSVEWCGGERMVHHERQSLPVLVSGGGLMGGETGSGGGEETQDGTNVWHTCAFISCSCVLLLCLL